MKPTICLLIISCVLLCGCDSDSPDHIMSNKVAVRNAEAHGGPPEGWAIVCDDQGHYAVRAPSGGVRIYREYFIRTSRFEATVVAWYLHGLTGGPWPTDLPAFTNTVWKECE